MNVYAYVNGNVVNLVDPMGLFEEAKMWYAFSKRFGNTGFELLEYLRDEGALVYGGQADLWGPFRKKSLDKVGTIYSAGGNPYNAYVLILDESLDPVTAAETLFEQAASHVYGWWWLNNKKQSTDLRDYDPGKAHAERLAEVNGAIDVSREIVKTYADCLASFVPGAGLAEAITAKSVTGRDLAAWERGLAMVPTVAFFKNARAANSLDDIGRALNKLADVPGVKGSAAYKEVLGYYDEATDLAKAGRRGGGNAVRGGMLGEQPRDALGRFMKKGQSGQAIPGASAVDDFATQAQRNGFDIVGREVTVSTPFGQRRYDLALRNRQTGLVTGVEIKSSEAAFTRFDAPARQQFAADRWLNAQRGAQAVGKHQSIQINDTIKIMWEVK